MVQPVDFILDGDTTFNAEAGERRRLHGINAPEISHSADGINMAGGEEAGARLGVLLAENPDAVWESMGRDYHGRDLGRYVTKNGKDLNETLVREGFAAPMDFGGGISPYHRASFSHNDDLRAGTAEHAIRGRGAVTPDEKSLTLAQEAGEGFLRGIDQTQGMLGFGISALARSIGMDSLANYGEELGVRNFQEAQQHAASVSSYKDINFDDGILKGLSDSAHFAIGILGEQVPQIGFDILAGAATGGLGAVGAAAVRKGVQQGVASHMANTVAKSAAKLNFNTGLFASMSLQQIGEIEAELQQNGVDSPATAILGGLAAGAIDYVAMKSLFKAASRLYKEGNGAKGAMVLREGLKSSTAEGLTEGAQTLVAKTAVLANKTGYDVFSDENVEETINAMIAGFLVGGTPSAVKGTLNTAGAVLGKVSGSKTPRPAKDIEDENQEILGITDARSDIVNEPVENHVVVEGTVTLADGSVADVGQELTTKDKAPAVKAKMQERAGDDEASFQERPPTEVIEERIDDGEGLTANEEFLSDDAKQKAQAKGVEVGKRPAALISEETLATLQKENSESLDANEMFVVRADGDRVFLVKGETQAQATAASLANASPVISKASEPKPKPSLTKKTPTSSLLSDKSLTAKISEEVHAKISKLTDDRLHAGIKRRTKILEAELANDGDFVSEYSGEALGNMHGELIAMESELESRKNPKKEEDLGLEPSDSVPQPNEDDLNESEERQAKIVENDDGFDEGVNGPALVAIAPVPFEEDLGPEPSDSVPQPNEDDLNESEERREQAAAREEDETPKKVDPRDGSVYRAFRNGDIQKTAITKIGIKAYALKVGLDPELLAEKLLNVVETGRLGAEDKKVMLENLRKYYKEEGVEFGNNATDEKALEIEALFDSVFQEGEGTQGVRDSTESDDSPVVNYIDEASSVSSEFITKTAKSNPAITDPAKTVFKNALASGMEVAQSMLKRRALLDSNDKDFADFGFDTIEAFMEAKAYARRNGVYAGKPREDLTKSMLLFSYEGETYPVFLPAALRVINNAGLARFGSVSTSSNFNANALDQVTTFIGDMAVADFIPLVWPDAKNAQISIVHRPKNQQFWGKNEYGDRTQNKAPLMMVDLVKFKKREAKGGTSDISTLDFYEIGKEQQMIDAVINLERMGDKLTALVRKRDSTFPRNPVDPTPKFIALGNQINQLAGAIVDQVQMLEEIEEQGELDIVSAQEARDALLEGSGRASKEEAALDFERQNSTEVDLKGFNNSRKVEKTVGDNDTGTPAHLRARPTPRKRYKPKQKPLTFQQKTSKVGLGIMAKAGIVSKVRMVSSPKQKKVATVSIENGNVVISFNMGMLERLHDESPETYTFVIAHEIGHAFVAETMHNMPQSLLADMHSEFKKARAKAPSGHPYRRGKGVGFDEWLADQFATVMTETNIKNKAKVDNPAGRTVKFLREVAAKLKALADSISSLFGKDRMSDSESGKAFMRAMMSSGINNKDASISGIKELRAFMNLEFGGNYPHTRAENRRLFLERRALGKEIAPNSKESLVPRDYTMGQALNDTSDMGRAAINAFGREGKSIITDPAYIPKRAAAIINGSREKAPLFFTTHNILKNMGGVAHIATAYRSIFNNATSDSSIWQTQADKALSSVSDSELSGFIDGTKGIPTGLSSFMDRFHTRLKNDMPTLGYVRGFFPRVYDNQAIETRRDEMEALLVEQAFEKGVDFTKQNAAEAVDSILQDPLSGLEELEGTPQVFGSDPFSQKPRVLDFIADEVLRQNGFLRTDVDVVLKNYVHRMTRRAAYEREISDYTPLITKAQADKASTKSKKNTTSFAKKLFLSIPFKNEDGRVYTFEEKDELFGDSDIHFFDKNRKYFAEAKRMGWLKEVKDKEGNKEWLYYDKNARLREAYSGLPTGEKRKQFVKIISALEGRYGADEISQKSKDVMSNMLAIQNLIILPFSGFSQLAELSGIIFRNRDMAGAFSALKEVYKLFGSVEGKERRELMADAGFAHKQLANQAILESYGINYQSPFAQKVNDFLFKANGMNFITNASRVMGAAVAERFIQRHATKAEGGSSRSARYLKEIGLTIDQAKFANSQAYRPYSEFLANGDTSSDNALKAEAIHKAMFRFVDSAIVRPNATQRPVIGSDPRFMLVWHLKSFMYAYGSAILGGLGGEVKARFNESKIAGGSVVKATLEASVPLMVYALPVLLMSGLALELRDLVQYKILGLGSTPRTDSLHGADYLTELVRRAGALGPMEMAYSFSEDVDKGRSPIINVLGPTAQHLSVLLEFDAANSVNRSVPVLAQNPLFKDWTRELLR